MAGTGGGMNRPIITIKPPTDHFSEVILLGIIAISRIFAIRQAISLNHAAEASAYTPNSPRGKPTIPATMPTATRP